MRGNYKGGLEFGRVDHVICSPEGVSLNQVVRVVDQYLDMHPANLHFDLAILADMALREAWPCGGAERHR
jgi:hypothetical protein